MRRHVIPRGADGNRRTAAGAGRRAWPLPVGLVVALVIVAAACRPASTLTETVALRVKDPETGRPVEGGASAEVRYRPAGPKFEFVLQARRLPRAESYCLIYLPDPWPGQGLIRLAQGSTDGGGNLQLDGAVDTGPLPSPADANRAAGASLWLVPTAVVGEDGLQDPDLRLCLQPLTRIRFDDTDGVAGAAAPEPTRGARSN